LIQPKSGIEKPIEYSMLQNQFWVTTSSVL